MLVVSKKHHGIPIVDCWFAKEPITVKGLIRYKECRFEPAVEDKECFRTLWSDLTLCEEEILSCYSKNCRYEVRRAAKEGVTAEVFRGCDLLQSNRIDEFVDFFVEFWKSKGIDYKEKDKCREEMYWYAQNNAFAITVARLQEKPLVYHTYILDDEIVRLYQSASQYRTDEEVSQQLVGFANRFLHKEDMLFFKGLGKRTYDWGGAGLTDEVASITKFKESFGGTAVELWNGTKRVGWMAKLYGRIVDLIR